jgi:UDP-N-acetylmuramate dehydrogenase
MARKNERARGRAGKRAGGARSVSRPRVAKRAAKAARPKAAAKAKAHVKGATPAKAKSAPAPKAPPGPKLKIRGRVLEHEPLSRYTTWRIGGPARYLVQPADAEDVEKALAFARELNLPWVVLGLGSNVLVRDGGFPGVVIRMGKGLDRFEMKGATAIVGAGLPTPLLARRTAEAGFVGVERFIGIPGTVGGGVYMNAGCHGAEFAEVVTEVTVLDASGRTRTLTRKQVPFAYRASNLGNVVVLEAKLGLGEESPAKLKEIQGRLLRWRKAGTPFDQPCAGSTFRNPDGPRSAGMLIDECGLKGHREGAAVVSPMHANYFVNTGTATANDVLRLVDYVRKTVRKRTGVELALEVKVIGQ